MGKRFQCLLEQMAAGMGRPLPLACGDWAATKAAYRFLDNDRVGEAKISNSLTTSSSRSRSTSRLLSLALSFSISLSHLTSFSCNDPKRLRQR